ncbi:MAG: hypothetical protein ACKO13_00420, partial [Cytophagales bacterium]
LQGTSSDSAEEFIRHFDKEYLAFLKALNMYSVKYVIIGGHAAIYHGVNRNTGDLDVFTEPTIKNGRLLLQALTHLQLQIPEIKDEEWNSQLVLSFGFEPEAIDILNFAPGLDFNQPNHRINELANHFNKST